MRKKEKEGERRERREGEEREKEKEGRTRNSKETRFPRSLESQLDSQEPSSAPQPGAKCPKAASCLSCLSCLFCLSVRLCGSEAARDAASATGAEVRDGRFQHLMQFTCTRVRLERPLDFAGGSEPLNLSGPCACTKGLAPAPLASRVERRFPEPPNRRLDGAESGRQTVIILWLVACGILWRGGLRVPMPPSCAWRASAWSASQSMASHSPMSRIF